MSTVTAGASPPSLDKISKLVARALGTTPDGLLASFRPATLADLPQILALRAQTLGELITWDDRTYLAWRYRLGRPDQGAGDCWVLVLGGELMGLIGTEDVALRLHGTALAGVRLMDTLIRPDLAGVGLGVWLSLVMRSRYPLVLAVGANPNSKGLVTRVFDVLPNRRTFVHPVRFDHFMAKRVKLGLVAWAGARLADGVMRLLRAWTLGIGRQGIRVSRLPALPDQIDRLLLAAQHPQRIEVVRSRAHWAWRLSTPRGRFDLWGAWQGEALVGVLITRRDTIEEGRQAWMVMDVVIDQQRLQPALKALLWHVLGQARRQGVDYLSVLSYRHDMDQVLRKAAFVEQPNEFRVMAWHCADEAWRAHAAAGADWSFNEIHSDGD